MEAPFWDALRQLAERRGTSIAAIVAEVDSSRDPASNLSSALRCAILADALERAG